MKFEDLIRATGLRIVEGGPFGYEDFGNAWVLMWEDEMTAVFKLDTQEVVFVEVVDIAESNQAEQTMYMWMNPEYRHFEKKIYQEVSSSVTHQVDDIQEVFNIWHKNQELYEDMPDEAREEMEAQMNAEREILKDIESGNVIDLKRDA